MKFLHGLEIIDEQQSELLLRWNCIDGTSYLWYRSLTGKLFLVVDFGNFHYESWLTVFDSLDEFLKNIRFTVGQRYAVRVAERFFASEVTHV